MFFVSFSSLYNKASLHLENRNSAFWKVTQRLQQSSKEAMNKQQWWEKLIWFSSLVKNFISGFWLDLPDIFSTGEKKRISSRINLLYVSERQFLHHCFGMSKSQLYLYNLKWRLADWHTADYRLCIKHRVSINCGLSLKISVLTH